MSRRDPRQGDDTWSGYDPDPPMARRADAGAGSGALGWPDSGHARARWRGRGPPATATRRGSTRRRAFGVRRARPPGASRRRRPVQDAGYDEEGYEAGYAEAYDDVYDDEVYDEPAAGFPAPRAGPTAGAAPHRAAGDLPGARPRLSRTAVLAASGS